MKKTICRVIAVIMYLISLCITFVYIDLQLKPYAQMSVLVRLCMLGLVALGIYFGSVFLGQTLDDNKRKKLMKVTTAVMFLEYLSLLVTFVLFDGAFGRNINNVYYWSKDMLSDYMRNSFNIIPFKTISKFTLGFLNSTVALKYVVINILGNILAFMPFALFIPILFPKLDNTKKFCIFMIVVIMLVEFLQFVTFSGSFDIDDLILNLLGAFIAYKVMCIKSVRKFIKKILI